MLFIILDEQSLFAFIKTNEQVLAVDKQYEVFHLSIFT